MKTIILLLVLGLFLQYIFCIESILSKFHQNNFKIRDVRMELRNYSEKYLHFVHVKTVKYNRTTPSISLTFRLKISVKDETQAIVQCNKFLSNEYRYFPSRFQVTLNEAVDSNAIGINAIKKCGNITHFYFVKDVTYHFCNFVIDETRFPPLVPNGRFRFDLSFLYLNEEIALLYLFAEIYTPIAYPKTKAA